MKPYSLWYDIDVVLFPNSDFGDTSFKTSVFQFYLCIYDTCEVK